MSNSTLCLPTASTVVKRSRFWKRRSDTVVISDVDPRLRVIYLGNVLTSWARGPGCIDKPLSILWRNHLSSTSGGHTTDGQANKAVSSMPVVRPKIVMHLTVCASGLKAVTKDHGLTEYWANRITYCDVSKSYPRLFCWIYRHEGRKLKQELRCHAVLCPSENKATFMAEKLQDRLHQALIDFKKEKISRQNARLSIANTIHEKPSMPFRKILLHTGTSNYRPSLAERSRSVPKLKMIDERDEDDFMASASGSGKELAAANISRSLATMKFARRSLRRLSLKRTSKKGQHESPQPSVDQNQSPHPVQLADMERVSVEERLSPDTKDRSRDQCRADVVFNTGSTRDGCFELTSIPLPSAVDVDVSLATRPHNSSDIGTAHSPQSSSSDVSASSTTPSPMSSDSEAASDRQRARSSLQLRRSNSSHAHVARKKAHQHRRARTKSQSQRIRRDGSEASQSSSDSVEECKSANASEGSSIATRVETRHATLPCSSCSAGFCVDSAHSVSSPDSNDFASGRQQEQQPQQKQIQRDTFSHSSCATSASSGFHSVGLASSGKHVLIDSKESAKRQLNSDGRQHKAERHNSGSCHHCCSSEESGFADDRLTSTNLSCGKYSSTSGSTSQRTSACSVGSLPDDGPVQEEMHQSPAEPRQRKMSVVAMHDISGIDLHEEANVLDISNASSEDSTVHGISLPFFTSTSSRDDSTVIRSQLVRRFHSCYASRQTNDVTRRIVDADLSLQADFYIQI